ncbi:MAG: hypothetical protein KA746_09490 [Pyrinomonadaceae bacterium]|nr:hypothetical protein [Pyrinomonadaceae bacterium]MBP6214353.1 hypothetical protein [Pyrinomonadaceae bacterium]
MKVLQQIFYTLVLVAGLSLAVSAQKNDDQKKPPPKPPPPVVNPQPKPPSDGNKPKKPGFAFVVYLIGKERSA